MSRSLLITTLVVLAITVQVRTQYIDFFQSLNTFIKPYQTTRRPDVTKRPANRQTNKRYQDAIFFENDQFVKQRESATEDPFTTSKPRRKTKTTTRKPTTKTPWVFTQTNSNKNVNVERTTISNKNYENNRGNGNNVFDSYNNYEVTIANNYGPTTERPYNYGGTQTTNPRPVSTRKTTMNPLLHRPGVRPAAVDFNRPPITNRPVTARPSFDRPFVTDRPVTTNRPTTIGYDSSDTTPVIETGPNEDDMSEAEKRRYIEMAEQKCDEYKAMNTKKIVALPLATVHATQGVELNVSTCTPTNIPLIIGGKPVSIQEFPHMGLVGWKNIQKVGYSWKCGGSLISEQYILTAGHCTYHDKDYNVISGPPAAVQLGSSYIDGQDSLVVSVASVVRHPKYKVRRSYYDVALIKLVTTVTFSESVSPACLGVPPNIGGSIIATGWGRTEFGGDASKELRSVAVSLWEMEECRAVWGTSRKMPEGPSSASQLCAGVRGGGKDTCQGDSGGPVQVQDGCSWRVVGVTSVGRSCGAVDTPALYAKLPRAFIASQVFTNVRINNHNTNQNNNNNQYNGNNNDNNNGNNNWSDNRFDNQGVGNQNGNRDEINRPGNHQTVGNNNWGVTSNNNNQFGNAVVSRPGNHQTDINNNNRDTVTNINNQFVSSQNTGNNRDDNTYRPGNHQVVYNNNDNRKDGSDVTYYGYNQNSGETIYRPGNHQTIDNSNNNNRGSDPVNYFVTSHTSGNHRDAVVARPGNHQTIDNNNRDTTTGNNYFVTSHTSGNNRDTVVRLPGNHQTLVSNNNGGTVSSNNNRYSDSQNSESNQDAVYDVKQESYDNNNGYNQNGTPNYYSNNQEDNASNTWATNNARPETNNNRYNNEENVYYNNEQPNINSQVRRTTKTFSNFGSQNSDYGTTENVSYNRNNNGYNENNNGYNVNNNRDFVVANRPWWNR